MIDTYFYPVCHGYLSARMFAPITIKSNYRLEALSKKKKSSINLTRLEKS